MAHLLKVGLGLAAAEVGECPCGIPEHGNLGLFVQLCQEGVERPMAEHEVSAVRRVASNVAQGPHSLLPNIVTGRAKQLYKDGDCAMVDHNLCVV